MEQLYAIGHPLNSIFSSVLKVFHKITRLCWTLPTFALGQRGCLSPARLEARKFLSILLTPEIKLLPVVLPVAETCPAHTTASAVKTIKAVGVTTLDSLSARSVLDSNQRFLPCGHKGRKRF